MFSPLRQCRRGLSLLSCAGKERQALTIKICAVDQRRCLSDSSQTVELAFERHDTGASPEGASPILVMHGLFGSKRNNRSISKMLSKELRRPIYALDLRNHGDSPHSSEHTYEAMAADVENFISEHGIKDTTLLGHSMGAKVAMTLAIRRPDLVQDIIAVDNAPVNAQLGAQFARYVQSMRKIESVGVKSQKEADAIFREVEEDLAIRQFLLTNMYRPDPATNNTTDKLRFRIPVKTLGAALDQMASFPFQPGTSARFENPALFVRGTRSKYVADETIPLIGEFFPRFQLKDVEAGHWVISENPMAFKDAVIEFLGRERE